MRRDEFAKRRRLLMRHMGREAIAILPAAPVRMRNNDVEYNYRPDSDFYYLTSFAEPEAVAVLIPGRPQGEFVLFVRDRDPAREAWDGARAGPDGAVKAYGADDAFPVSDIDEILPGLLENRSKVYYAMGTHPEFDQRSVRVVGSWNGVPFVFTSDVSAEQETEFSPPLTVDGTTGTDLTLFVDISTWFLVNGALVDPSQATDPQPLASQVKENIKASIRAFEDDDRDGEDDRGEDGGGHGTD